MRRTWLVLLDVANNARVCLQVVCRCGYEGSFSRYIDKAHWPCDYQLALDVKPLKSSVPTSRGEIDHVMYIGRGMLAACLPEVIKKYGRFESGHRDGQETL